MDTRERAVLLLCLCALQASLSSAQSVYTQQLLSHNEEGVGLQMNIGTPGQNSVLSLTLWNSFVFVASACCPECCCANQFASWQSSSYALDGYFSSYGTNFIDMERGFDYVQIRQNQGNPPRFNMTIISRLFSTQDWEGHAFDGSLGLSFTNSTSPKTSSFLDYMLNGRQLVYTIFKQRQCQNQDKYQVAGQVTYGGVDTSNCGVVSYEPMIDLGKDYPGPPMPLLNVESVTVGNTVLNVNDSEAVFTTLPYISMSKPVFHELNKVWGATIINENSLLIDCNVQRPAFIVNFGGTNSYQIPFQHLLRRTNGFCSLNVVLNDKGDYDKSKKHPLNSYEFVFGLPFLNDYCLVTDYANRRMGFAPHKNPNYPDCQFSSEEPAPCPFGGFDQHCTNIPPQPTAGPTTVSTTKSSNTGTQASTKVPTVVSTVASTTPSGSTTPTKAANLPSLHHFSLSLLLLVSAYIYQL